MLGGGVTKLPLLVELGVVDTGKRAARIVVGDLDHVVGEHEANAEHQIEAARREQPQPALAIGAIAGLDELGCDAELAGGALDAPISRVVERLVAAPTDVEDQAHAQRSRRSRPVAVVPGPVAARPSPRAPEAAAPHSAAPAPP